MLHDTVTAVQTLGADLRALRRARAMTLAELADVLDRSVGWLSQVERGKSDPSITDLRHMARALDVSVSSLFRQDAIPVEEQGLIVRADLRRPIGSRGDGLTEELLSPDLTDDFEVVHSTFEPFSKAPELISRPTQEVGYLIAGKLTLAIDGRSFNLDAGDSFRIKGQPYHWSNPHADPAKAIWVIAPPVY